MINKHKNIAIQKKVQKNTVGITKVIFKKKNPSKLLNIYAKFQVFRIHPLEIK